MAYLLAILEIVSRRTPNSEFVRNKDESDECMIFEQNPSRMKKVITCQRNGMLDRLTDGSAKTIGLPPTPIGRVLKMEHDCEKTALIVSYPWCIGSPFYGYQLVQV